MALNTVDAYYFITFSTDIQNHFNIRNALSDKQLQLTIQSSLYIKYDNCLSVK